MRSFFLWVNYWPDDSSLNLLTMSMKIPLIWCDSEIRKKTLLSNHLLKRENKIFNIFSRLLYESCCFVVYFLLTMIEDSGFLPIRWEMVKPSLNLNVELRLFSWWQNSRHKTTPGPVKKVWFYSYVLTFLSL